MRILYIITQGEQGGGQKHVLDLAAGMREKGHEVYVAIGEIENDGDKWLFETLEKNGFKKDNLFELKKVQREIKIWRDTCSVFEIIKLIRKIKPNVVHLHSSKVGAVGVLACWIYNFSTSPNLSLQRRGTAKTVYTVHGFVFLEPMNILKKIIYIAIEFFASLFRNFTILISQKDIDVGKKFWILRTKSSLNYKLIYNGVSEKIKSEMLSKEEAREFLFEKVEPHLTSPINRGGTLRIVGTISNLFKTKGLEYFIEAAALACSGGTELPLIKGGGGDFLFFVLGTGPEEYRNELQNKINNLGLQNHFFLLGKVPNASRYLKAFDLFALTSVKEGLPYCLLEAKMAGVPILATRVGGIPEMAKNFPINLVESKNVQEISNKILELLALYSPSYQGGARGGLIEDNLPQIYSLENMVNQTELVYKNMLN